MLCLKRLKSGAEFAKMKSKASAFRSHGFILLYLKDESIGLDCFEVGFIASKKVGGAVQRNRCKRRMRALALGVFPKGSVASAYRFVMIAKSDMLTENFAKLQTDLNSSLKFIGRAAKS